MEDKNENEEEYKEADQTNIHELTKNEVEKIVSQLKKSPGGNGIATEYNKIWWRMAIRRNSKSIEGKYNNNLFIKREIQVQPQKIEQIMRLNTS